MSSRFQQFLRSVQEKCSRPKEKNLVTLEDALGCIDSQFYAKGAVQAPLTLSWGGQTPKTVTFPMSLADAQQQLPDLIAAAQPSAFCHNKQTKYDSSVRVAKELTAEQMSLDFDPAATGILNQIHARLVPEAASVRAELYKLNIMTQGSFFKPHKDTPRGGDTCFGTLVVCLPVPFNGGPLFLKHGNERTPADLGVHWLSYGRGAELEQFVPSCGLTWAAFFGDVEHEILEVLGGYRLTLTYTLHRETSPNPTADVLLSRASTFHNALAAALADTDFMTDGGAIGVYCKHLYEEDALKSSEAKLAAGGSNAYAAQLKLKNEDAVVAAVFAAAGLEVKCLRMLTYADMGDLGPWVMKEMPYPGEAYGFGSRQLIDGCLWATGVTTEDVADWCEGNVEDVVGQSVEFLGSRSERKSEWVTLMFSGTDNFGNEAESMTFYTSAAFVALVPSFEQRKRLAAAARKCNLSASTVCPAAADAGTQKAAAAADAGGVRGGDVDTGTDQGARGAAAAAVEGEVRSPPRKQQAVRGRGGRRGGRRGGI